MAVDALAPPPPVREPGSPPRPPREGDGGGGDGDGGGGRPGGSGPPVSPGKLGVLVFCVFVTMLFAGFLSVYVIVRGGAATWPPPGFPPLPVGLWVSTVLIVASSAWLLLVLYYTEQIRGAVLILFLNSFIFGILRLRTAQFLGAALFVLAGYGVVIALLAKYHPQSIDIRIEVLQWVLLAMALPWFAVIGAYISNVRSALRQKNLDLEKALGTIERLASHDELTGAYSRRFFLDALRREKTRSDREHRAFCLAMLDLDSFKAVNDKHGHMVGDDVLREFAEAVQLELRGSDYFARYGGEEFALLLVDTDLPYASAVLERIRRRIETNSFSHVGRKVTVSSGIAQYRLHEDLSGTLGRADRALYSAKAAGRNRVEQAAP